MLFLWQNNIEEEAILMSKKLFTKEEIEILKTNKYVKNVSEKE